MFYRIVRTFPVDIIVRHVLKVISAILPSNVNHVLVLKQIKNSLEVVTFIRMEMSVATVRKATQDRYVIDVEADSLVTPILRMDHVNRATAIQMALCLMSVTMKLASVIVNPA